MKQIACSLLLLLGLWGCAGEDQGESTPQGVAVQGVVTQALTGAWINPDHNIEAGILLHQDGTCVQWTRDFMAFPGTWSITGEESETPELHLVMGEGIEEMYRVARHNAHALQLQGNGTLSGLLRRGTVGVLEGNAAFRDDVPEDGVLKVVLERYHRNLGALRSTEREFLDDYQSSVGESPVPFTLNYIQELVRTNKYEVRVWIEGSDETVYFASDRAHAVNLHEPQPLTVVLRAVRR